MRRLTRFAITVVSVCAVVAAARVAGAVEGKALATIAVETEPVYSAVVRPPGRRVESVLTNPRGAVVGKKGTGWLLHSGTPHDTCERPDASSGLRMVCLAW